MFLIALACWEKSVLLSRRTASVKSSMYRLEECVKAYPHEVSTDAALIAIKRSLLSITSMVLQRSIPGNISFMRMGHQQKHHIPMSLINCVHCSIRQTQKTHN